LPDPVLRDAAVRQFFALRLNNSNPELVPKFANDSSPKIRAQAFRYYQRSNDKVSPDTLNEWLMSDYKDVRQALVSYTLKLSNQDAEEYLLELIIDDDTPIRLQTLNEYARRRLSGFKRTIVLSFGDDNVEVQKLSVRLMLQLMGPEGNKILSNYVIENPGTPLAIYIKALLRSQAPIQR